MYKKILVIVLFLLTLNHVVAADIELSAHVYSEYTIFNYILTFNENETIDKLSLEKPKDATIDYIVGQNGPIDYEIAGDYIILKPTEVDNNVFLLKLKTKSLSEEIQKTESFRTYQNFNFEVRKFKFNIILKKDFGEIIDIFPVNYTITNNERIEWEQTNLQKNSLYVINFKQEIPTQETFGNHQYIYLGGILIVGIMLILILLLIIYPRYLKKYLKKEEKEIKQKNRRESDIKEDSKSEIVNNENEVILKTEKIIDNKFEEIIEKHLTENEKSVVHLIKKEEGITQQEILNYVPSLTKSNLSKIISKLHAKRILKRIKVGKINNIYLGEKLKFEEIKLNKENKLEEEEF